MSRLDEGSSEVVMERTMDSRDLYARLGDEEVLVLDCRNDEEWPCWDLQIPGALAMTYRELSEGAHVLPDDELIVLCGCAPDGNDAKRAQRLLGLRGRSAVILEGGLRTWVTLGYPTERHFAGMHGPGEAESEGTAKNG